MPETLIKTPGEDLVYAFEFAELLETGETISAVVSVTGAPTGLTVGSPSVSGTTVRVRISSGSAGIRYCLKCTITTSLSNTRIGAGKLEVVDHCDLP